MLLDQIFFRLRKSVDLSPKCGVSPPKRQLIIMKEISMNSSRAPFAVSRQPFEALSLEMFRRLKQPLLVPFQVSREILVDVSEVAEVHLQSMKTATAMEVLRP